MFEVAQDAIKTTLKYNVDMSNTKRVVIIDDDLIITKAAKYLLNDEFNVEVFDNGDKFLADFIDSKTDKPDIILLDIMMPGSDGVTVLNIIKKNDDLKNVPVIIVSALSYNDFKTKFEFNEDVNYITKPYDFDDLKTKIKNII